MPRPVTAPPARRPAVARRMTAREQLSAGRTPRRLCQLVVGLVGYGTSLTLLLLSSLGAPSWSVLAEGTALRTGTTFGTATSLIAVVVLLAWIPLRELPGLGTVLNVVLVGASADAAAVLLPPPVTGWQQLGYLLAGVLLLAVSDAAYLGARFGAGPRDGLMTGAVRVTGRPVWLVRTGIELVVLTAGWSLGGTVGPGTVLVAVLMGPLVQFFLRHATLRLDGDTGEVAAGGRAGAPQ